MDQDNVEAFAHDGKVITDDNNYMATRSAKAMDDQTVIRGRAVFETLKDFDPLLQPDSDLRSKLGPGLNYPYMATRLRTLFMNNRAVELSDSLVDAGDPQSLAMIGLGLEGQGQRTEAQQNLLLALKADPNNAQARYSLLLPWYSKLVKNETDDLPDNIKEELAKFSGPAAATLEGGRALEAGDMQRLANLDPYLAAARPSDLWYQVAVNLRVQWRIRVTNPEYQPRLANEATQLIDSAIAFNGDNELYMLRLQSTSIADDIVSAYQTASRSISKLHNQISRANNTNGYFEGSSAKQVRSQVQEVLDFAIKIENDDRIDQDKRAWLKASAISAQNLAKPF